MLEQRQPVYGAFIKKILPVGCSEHFHSDWPFIQRATVDGAVSSTANELKAVKVGGRETLLDTYLQFLSRSPVSLDKPITDHVREQ